MDDTVMAARTPFWWREKTSPRVVFPRSAYPRSRSSEPDYGGTEGMNFIAKHFFEYQSFMNLPHKAVHLHKVPASQAGTDPSMGWAPKNMLKAGKHQPAPAARANRVHRRWPRFRKISYERILKVSTCIVIFTLVVSNLFPKRNFPLKPAVTNPNCLRLIENLQFDIGISAILIDEKILKNLNDEICLGRSNQPVNVDYEKDYLEFHVGNETKIIPKRVKFNKYGNLNVPNNIPQFLEFLRRSKLLKCRNITMNRKEKGKSIDESKRWIRNLAKVRDTLLEYDIIPFLSSGSLLGWYRECGLIPHTTDMDLAIFRDDYNPEFLQDLLDFKLDIWATRLIGKLNDSMEFTVRGPYLNVGIDIFIMYKPNQRSRNMTFVTGVSSEL
ncbi:unnamed protein product [Caenorhabditis bovis]|uniref:Fukutin n=1 Tax=Caenorhabditis bovis TaxID=2654633 RepID=A0A8S1EWJ4_9PELO|nr:unnamed protein product [Caenorhabditis bovis]